MHLDKSRVIALAILASCTLPSDAPAQSHTHDHSSSKPYAGLESRQIKSLSEEDIAQIRAGSGWGLALPAELNGRPGPAHLLELQQELDLTPDQLARIAELHARMKQEAQKAGELFIEKEAALSQGFTRPDLTAQELRNLIDEAAAARANLRLVHLEKHLETPPLLTAAQIEKYKVLRGYKADPCTSVPDGHDPAMWLKHNGCS